ncbi:hypothetical protein [Aerosakkonema funiforme]|uniref:Flagellar assembly protein H n=1 Tax=Aerosakkonema funiforme FACHB-1375 TaxID=2949571 RepID=A0A926VIM9_9CYAN|nr:hypothetical protein [Aerosakkonema funiforme]MBD2184519.1 hypothetical protein [Aerosakkonema funiforme FACHB-1375]
MTRFIHDRFTKDCLEELLTPYGQVKPAQKVSSEIREIDVLFIPNAPPETLSQDLGLLGRLGETAAIFEPFRNAIDPDEVCACLLKALEVRESIQRQAKRKNAPDEPISLPYLWILTPTASASILEGFRAILEDNWGAGVYFLPYYLRTAIVVIHQLPKTPETLWLRIWGKKNVQKQAIDELEALPPDNVWRERILELFYQLRENLTVNQSLEADDRELVMRLQPLLQEKLAQSIQQGIQQGERLVVENLLKARFGELDAELSALIDSILSFPPEEFTPLLLQLSREELVTRFRD